MDSEVFVIPLGLSVTAVVLGSMQGATFAASFKRIDMLGVTLIATVCGIGGSIIRDTLIGVPPAVFTTNIYLLACIIAGLIGMLLQRILIKVDPLINILDAVSLGAFAALGTTKALAHSVPFIPAVIIGTTAAVGGGILRDLLLNLPVAAMHVGSFYAVAAIVGSAVTASLWLTHTDITVAGLSGVVVTALLRLLSMRYGWSLPEQRAIDRIRRRKAREVEQTIEAIRTQTIQLGQIPDIDPEGPRGTPPSAL